MHGGGAALYRLRLDELVRRGREGVTPRSVALAQDFARMYSHMTMRSAQKLDATFNALSDGTRRSMIHALARGEARSAGELGRRFRSAQPTISRHLKVLEQAGLVERMVEGRIHRFRLRREALQEANGWLTRHQAFWTGALDQLEQLLSGGTGDAL